MDVPEVDCAEAVELRTRGAAWLDVREQDEWDDARIPDTTHVPLRGAIDHVVRELPERDAPIVVSCLSGGRSGQVVAYLRELGYVDVHNLRGGIRAWVQEGRPVIRGD